MTRNELACYMLIASAFVLGGLLATQVADRFENRADAGVVVSQGNYTILSSRISDRQEMVTFLDNNTGTMVGYLVDIDAKAVRAVARLDIGDLFARAATPRSGGAGR